MATRSSGFQGFFTMAATPRPLASRKSGEDSGSAVVTTMGTSRNRVFRAAWTKAGHRREPRVSVSRSVIPIASDLDRRLFGADRNEDQVGWLDGAISRFGRTYTGEPDRVAEELAADAAVQAADTILLTVPSQLGVDYNAAMLETIARDIAPAIGWSPKNVPEPVG